MQNVRPDRPRLIAPAYKWQALPSLIKSDPYLKGWNDTIFGNATDYFSLPPVVYFLDGDSGILDNARDVKRRVKAFAYAYLMTNDTRWVDRTWVEIQVICCYCVLSYLFTHRFFEERRRKRDYDFRPVRGQVEQWAFPRHCGAHGSVWHSLRLALSALVR